MSKVATLRRGRGAWRAASGSTPDVVLLPRCRRNLPIRPRAGCPLCRITALWGICAVCPSSRIDKYRGTMRFREERIDFAPLPVECQRMCACFGWHHLLAAHRGNIDDIYYPRVADGHVKVRGLRM